MRRSFATSFACRSCRPRDGGLQLRGARPCRRPFAHELRRRAAASVQRPRPRAGDGGGRPVGLAARRPGAVAVAADVPGGDGGWARRSASSGVALPWVEVGIAGSVLVLGAAVALALRPSLAISVPLIAAVRAAARLQPRRRTAGRASGARATARASSRRPWRCTRSASRIGLPAGRIPVRFAARTAGGAIAALGVVLLVYGSSRRRAWLRLRRRTLPGKISDLITTGTAPELSSMRADVDVVELLEFEPVDRHHRRSSSFISSCRWMPSRPPTSPSPASTSGWPLSSTVASPSTTPRQNASSRWNVAEPCHGTNTATGCSPPARSSRLSIACGGARDRGRIDGLAVERQRRRDHRHVAQRHRVERRDIDRAAAELDGVLRGADHGGADALDRRLEPRAERLDAGADFRGAAAGRDRRTSSLSLP